MGAVLLRCARVQVLLLKEKGGTTDWPLPKKVARWQSAGREDEKRL